MLNSDKSSLLQTSLIKLGAAVATFKNLLNMTVLGERLTNTNKGKVCEKFWAMPQCVLKVPV